MKSLFNYENGVWTALGKLGDVMILNVVFILCSIPIITIGAAKSAMYAVAKRMSKNEEGYIIREFFAKFKENFKYSTYLWILYLVFTFLAAIDIYACSLMEQSAFVTFCRTFMVFTLLAVNSVFIYGINLVNIFENTFKNTLKNAGIMALGHFPYTLLILVVELSPVIALLVFTPQLEILLMLYMTVWFAASAIINSIMFNKVFEKYIKQAQEQADVQEVDVAE